MLVRFWGVRGSVPVPGPSTLKIGGNTSCVSVENDQAVLVLDAGTGIKDLGLDLRGDPRPIVVFTSHLHWDHVIGFPYFSPIWEKDRAIHVIATNDSGESPLDLLDGKHFPKHHSALPANCQLVEGTGAELVKGLGFGLSRIGLNHPGGSWGFRVEDASASLCYISDNELDGPAGAGASFDDLVEFCSDSDLLCHDAQFSHEEMPAHLGWGHSSVRRVCELASSAKTDHLVLFHHDPMRKDSEIHDTERQAQELLAPEGIKCTAAWEGLSIEL